jgi:hypothetical protein
MLTIIVTLLGGMQESGHGTASTLVGLLEHPEQMALACPGILQHYRGHSPIRGEWAQSPASF